MRVQAHLACAHADIEREVEDSALIWEGGWLGLCACTVRAEMKITLNTILVATDFSEPKAAALA